MINGLVIYVKCPHVSKLPLTSRGTEVESQQGALYVEDGSIVLRSGTVKTLRFEKCGSQTVCKVTEMFGNISVQVGKMKVAVTHKKTP